MYIQAVSDHTPLHVNASTIPATGVMELQQGDFIVSHCFSWLPYACLTFYLQGIGAPAAKYVNKDLDVETPVLPVVEKDSAFTGIVFRVFFQHSWTSQEELKSIRKHILAFDKARKRLLTRTSLEEESEYSQFWMESERYTAELTSMGRSSSAGEHVTPDGPQPMGRAGTKLPRCRGTAAKRDCAGVALPRSTMCAPCSDDSAVRDQAARREPGPPTSTRERKRRREDSDDDGDNNGTTLRDSDRRKRQRNGIGIASTSTASGGEARPRKKTIPPAKPKKSILRASRTDDMPTEEELDRDQMLNYTDGPLRDDADAVSWFDGGESNAEHWRYGNMHIELGTTGAGQPVYSGWTEETRATAEVDFSNHYLDIAEELELCEGSAARAALLASGKRLEVARPEKHCYGSRGFAFAPDAVVVDGH